MGYINSEGAASYGICLVALPRRFLGRFGTQPMILTEKRWYCIQYVCVYIYMHTHVSIYLHMEAQDALKKASSNKNRWFLTCSSKSRFSPFQRISYKSTMLGVVRIFSRVAR
jgi:hypothetical protein